MTHFASHAVRLAAVYLAVLSAAPAPTFAGKRVANRTYVQSGPDGVSYARCTPASDEGSTGHTDIYWVGVADDKRIDRYDWYAPGGVTLGWSPVEGKIAVLAVINEERPDANWEARETLRFAIGGKVLRSYTDGELVSLGAVEQSSKPGGRHAAFRIAGCQQVPGTNEYDFVVEVAGAAKGEGTTLRFDITTGELRPDRPHVPIGAGDKTEAVRVARAFLARTHPRIDVGRRPPAAKYVTGVDGPMWIVTFDAAKSAKADAAADKDSYPFEVRLRPDGQVESTTSPEP